MRETQSECSDFRARARRTSAARDLNERIELAIHREDEGKLISSQPVWTGMNRGLGRLIRSSQLATILWLLGELGNRRNPV